MGEDLCRSINALIEAIRRCMDPLTAIINDVALAIKRMAKEKKARVRRRALKRSRRNSSTVKRYKHGRNYRSRVPARHAGHKKGRKGGRDE